NTELILADLAGVEKRRDRQQKNARGGDKVAKAEVALCEKLMPHLNAGKPAITLELSDEEKKVMREVFLLTGKPVIFACNVAESDLAALAQGQDCPAKRHVEAVKAYAATHFGTEAVVISAQIESELVDLSEAEASEYLAGLGVKSSGVSELIRAVYH